MNPFNVPESSSFVYVADFISEGEKFGTVYKASYNLSFKSYLFPVNTSNFVTLSSSSSLFSSLGNFLAFFFFSKPRSSLSLGSYDNSSLSSSVLSRTSFLSFVS